MYHHPRHDIDSEGGPSAARSPKGDGADGEVTCTYLSATPVSPARVVLHRLGRVLDVEPGVSQLPCPHLTQAQSLPAAQLSPRPQRRCGCHHQLMREGAKRACTFLL